MRHMYLLQRAKIFEREKINNFLRLVTISGTCFVLIDVLRRSVLLLFYTSLCPFVGEEVNFPGSSLQKEDLSIYHFYEERDKSVINFYRG
jgi:hypothetical protein